MKPQGAVNRIPGFTRSELLVVIAIIGILASMLLPVLQQAKVRALAVNCLNNQKQLQLGWQLYTGENQDYIPGNQWQMEAGQDGFNRGSANWLTGWLDPRFADNPDNTNLLLFLNPQWSALGYYISSPNVFRCPASRLRVQESGSYYPLARTVSMNGWMGYTIAPSNPGFELFHKTTDIVKLSYSNALVFMDERDDSVDDGCFAIDMVGNEVANVPSDYHGGSAEVTFADGHAESHRWVTPEIQIPQPSGTETVKQQFIPVSPGSADLAWLRAHATAPE